MNFCERCGINPANRRERYCPACRRAVLRELRDAGYLKPAPRLNSRRSRDHRQDTSREPSSWQENAVRALEDGGLV